MGDAAQGDERAPKPEKNLQHIMEGLGRYLPNLTKAIASNEGRYEGKLFKAQKKYAPKQLGLEAFLYKQFAPKFANTQEQLSNIQAQGDLSRMQNFGSQGIRTAGNLAREQDPEYYGTRSLAANKLGEMINSPLSGNEMEALTRGVQRMRINSGTGDIMGNVNTAANAMLYGNAARNRQVQNMQLAQGMLPTLQSADMSNIYQLASGRPLANTQQQAQNAQLSGAGREFGSNLVGNLFGNQRIGMDINANRRTVSDFAGQAWGNVVGSVLGCWIAREVFGEESPKWRMFREWLMTKAPDWFRRWYMKNGQKVAIWLKDKPNLKLLIGIWMERKIYA